MPNHPSAPLIVSDPKKYAFVLRYLEEHDEHANSSRIIIDLDDVTENVSWRFTTLEPALDRIRETIFQLNSCGNPTDC
jgi:hypothetical protein